MFHNIKRNKLDYILTDMVPVEVSELFTLRHFYDYLNSHPSLIDMKTKLSKLKTQNLHLFTAGWNSIPLEYDICKRNGNMRKMSIPNPLGILMAYTFVSLYEKEILNNIREHNIFSLRYHVNNSKMYYQTACKRIVQYFSNTAKQIDKRAIEQSGNYYAIKKYRGINDFTNSKKWFALCRNFSKIAKIDYKDCFRTIYSHAFNWFVLPNINDSKDASNNAGLYTTLDNVMQRINGSATNGLIVGPEFSRMVAEIFLQNIDIRVYEYLNKQGLTKDSDYFIGRYVDDIFIFSNSEKIIDIIIKAYSTISSNYFMSLNENKLIRENLPINQSPWFVDTFSLSKDLSDLFYNDSDDEPYYYKKKSSIGSNYKQKLNHILCENNFEFKDTIVAYLLSTVLNLVKPRKKGNIFCENFSKSKLLNLLDYVVYIYSQSPSFNNTQRLISIIYYISSDINNASIISGSLKIIFKDYASIFKANVFDIINLFPLLSENGIALSVRDENEIENKIIEYDDPILLANWLSYSKYNKKYFSKILNVVTNILTNKLSYLTNKKESLFMYRECWFLFVFYNCPFITSSLRIKIRDYFINVEKSLALSNADDIAKKVITEYMLASKDGFFDWTRYGNGVHKQIAYRTNQMTIFRNGGKKYKIFDYTSF